jgi:hypothetical protein
MSLQTDLYDSIYNDVITLTGRPDLADETAVAIRTATLSIHGRTNWPRDLQTQLVKLPNSSNITALDIQVLFPRFRGLASVRITDVNFSPINGPDAIIEPVEVGDIYDPIYGQLRNNIAYVGGTTLNIRNYTACYGYLVDYYSIPQVRRDAYSSWIAQLSPDAIVYQAASIVLSTNGNEEKAKAYSNMVEKQLVPDLVSNFLTTIMR